MRRASASVVPPMVVGLNSSDIWPSSEPDTSGRKIGLQTESLDDLAHLLDVARA